MQKYDSMQYQKITGEFIVVKSQYLHREGTNDYTKDKLIIEDIVDKTGSKVKPVWGKDWEGVTCGIETRGDSDQRQVRIYRKASGARIKFQEYHEYGAYDDYRNSSVDSRYYWVQYEGT